MNPSGWNPMRHDCKIEGCYNVKHRPKIEVFADCFPGKINFGDIDASIVERNSRALLLEWKSFELIPTEIPGGQRITYENLSRTGFMTVAILVGNAETMEVRHYGFYFGGEFRGWKNGGLDAVKTHFTKWDKWAMSLLPMPKRIWVPRSEMSPAECAQMKKELEAHRKETEKFIAELDAHETDFFPPIPEKFRNTPAHDGWGVNPFTGKRQQGTGINRRRENDSPEAP